MTLGIRETMSLAGIAVCGLAVVKGGSAERWGGAFIAGAWTIAFAAQVLIGKAAPTLAFVSAVGLVIDIMLACGFLWLALRFSSLWLAAAMMLQSIQLALYGSFMAVHNSGHQADEYAVASNIQSGLLLIAILGGTLASWRRRATANVHASRSEAVSA